MQFHYRQTLDLRKRRYQRRKAWRKALCCLLPLLVVLLCVLVLR
jgi:hypothetical protein